MTPVPLEFTSDQFTELLQTLATKEGSNSAILVFVGVIAIMGILSIVWWVLNLRLKPLEELSGRLERLNDALVSTNEKIGDINAKMWSNEALENKIAVIVTKEIKEHEKNCPLRHGISTQAGGNP